MSEITIVTAFFDIGRGNWTIEKGHPHYLHRTSESYLHYFSYMAALENEMVVFTSADIAEKVKQIRGERKTIIEIIDFKNSFQEMRERIASVQKNREFIRKINPLQLRNPEYWNADYVLVNHLKSTFVNGAIEKKYVSNKLVAWLDFGFCRAPAAIEDVKKWNYNFNKAKIHLFNIIFYKKNTPIIDIISNNIVYITGSVIVASKEMWPKLEALMRNCFNVLIKNNLIDDDQTLLLMSYLLEPDLFELHWIHGNHRFNFKEFQD